MTSVNDEGYENELRDSIIRQLRQNLAKCRKILADEKLDLKTRERWTQLFNNTSTTLNQILKDRQMREFEMMLKEIREYRKRQAEAVFLPTITSSEKTVPVVKNDSGACEDGQSSSY